MDEELGKTMRAARVAIGLSLRELARITGITAVTLGEWERGVKPMHMGAQAIVFGMICAELAKRQPPPKPLPGPASDEAVRHLVRLLVAAEEKCVLAHLDEDRTPTFLVRPFPSPLSGRQLEPEPAVEMTIRIRPHRSTDDEALERAAGIEAPHLRLVE